MNPIEFLAARLADPRPRRTLLSAPLPREAVAVALNALRGELAADGSVRGAPDDWRRTTRDTLREMFGAQALQKHLLARAFIERDRRLAAGLWLSGLIDHPAIVICALRAAEQQP